MSCLYRVQRINSTSSEAGPVVEAYSKSGAEQIAAYYWGGTEYEWVATEILLAPMAAAQQMTVTTS